MDRTSQLPAEILDHILSFLPSAEAARMSGLSTTWKNAYDSLSFLDFGEFFIHKRIEEIVNVVDPILKHRQKQVEKFSLLLSNQWSRKVYNWINILVDCNIKELNLGVRPRILHSKVPYAIFNVKSIQVLKLSGFHIELPSNSTIIFSSSLRELYLDHVIFDEEFMQALSSCCNLEVFAVEYLNGLSSFQTCLPKLKKVKVASCYSALQLVDIRAANIQELDIYSYSYKNVLNVVIVTDCCTDLKSLCLSGVAMTQKWFDEIFTSLKNLEKLDLNSCDRLKTVKISSILLKQLRLYKCDNVIDVELNTPNLIKFVYDCPPSLPSLKLKGSASLEAKIAYGSGGGRTPNHDWYLKLMKLLDNFNKSMSLELTCKNEEVCPPNSLTS